MKKLNMRRMGSVLFVALVLVAFMVTPAFAAQTGTTNFDSVTVPIVNLINSLLTPILSIVGAVGALYCVVLGVKYAKAEEPQDREKAKSHLKNAIIGFVLIFVLMLALKLSMPILQNWVATNTVVNAGAAANAGAVTPPTTTP